MWDYIWAKISWLEEQLELVDKLRSDQLIRDFLGLFLAGTGRLMLSLFPDVQERALKEVLEQVGKSRPHRWATKPNFHFSVPWWLKFFVTRVCWRPIWCTGLWKTRKFSVTTFRRALWFTATCSIVHHDSDSWANPEDFYPEHFLPPEGAYTQSKCLFLSPSIKEWLELPPTFEVRLRTWLSDAHGHIAFSSRSFQTNQGTILQA